MFEPGILEHPGLSDSTISIGGTTISGACDARAIQMGGHIGLLFGP